MQCNFQRRLKLLLCFVERRSSDGPKVMGFASLHSAGGTVDNDDTLIVLVYERVLINFTDHIGLVMVKLQQ